MKKINLKNLSTDEILSKDQLQRIIAGDASGVEFPYTYYCTCNEIYQGWTIPYPVYNQTDIENANTDMLNQCGYNFSCSPFF